MSSTSKKNSSQIIKNVLLNWLAVLATLATGFFMSPFLVRNLGDSVYGVWVLLGSLVGYLGLLDFGITPSIIKYVAEYRARNDQQAINRVVTVSLVVFTGVGLISLALAAVIAIYFNDIFNSPLSRSTAAAVAMLAGINLAFTFPASVFVGVVRGYQRYDVDSAITTLNILARSVLLVALVLRGYGIVALAMITFVFDMMRLALLALWAYRLNPDIRIAREYFDREQLKKLFGFGLFAFLIYLGRQMILYTDFILIGLFLSTSSVTIYFIAARLVEYLRHLVAEMVGVLAPTASHLDASDDQAALKELLIVSTKYTLLIALPIASVFFVIGDLFIALWMGPGYEASELILVTLTIGILAHLLAMPSETFLMGIGKHRIVARLTILQAFANLLLSLLLVPSLGLFGIALGSTIPLVAFVLFSLPIYFRRYLKLELGEYLRRAVPVPLAIQAPFVMLLLVIRNYGRPSSLLTFFSMIAAALVPYVWLAFWLCISKSERRVFMRLTERFRLKPASRYYQFIRGKV